MHMPRMRIAIIAIVPRAISVLLSSQISFIIAGFPPFVNRRRPWRGKKSAGDDLRRSFAGRCGQLPNPSMGLMPLLSRKSSTAAGSALLSSRGRVNRAWGPVMPSAKAMEPSSAMENSSWLGRNP